MKKLKKIEHGFSIITLILIILIIILGIIIYSSFVENNTTSTVDYQNYFNEELSSTNNIALRYYYNQLEEPAKIMYTTILENTDSLKSGTEPIKFPSSVSDSIIEIGGNENENYFQSAWDAVTLDNLELFFVDTTKLSVSTRTSAFLNYKSYGFTLAPQAGTTYYNSSFNNAEEINNAINEVQNVANEIVSNEIGTRFDKVLYVHDWLVDNLDYDNNDTDNKDNIYGTFINKKVVCEGYAEGLKYLLDKLNIPCVLVYGAGYDDNGNEEAHAWNYVQMEDGNWYAVDATWDDPLYIGSGSSLLQREYKYKYFLKGAKTFNKNHVNDGDVSGSGQDFKYPELAENDYEN